MCCLINHVYMNSFRSIIEATEKFSRGWEHLNSVSARWGGNFPKIFQKFKCPGGCPGGGDVEASIWLVHNLFFHSVHTTREKFEDAAFVFVRLGLSSTLIRHENRDFRKRSSNRRNLTTPAFHFRVEGKHFENGFFQKRWRHDNHVI